MSTPAHSAASPSLPQMRAAPGHQPPSGNAGTILNRKVPAGASVTRYEQMRGSPPDMLKPTPYLFCTSVRILDDANARGAKGTSRSRAGTLLSFVNDTHYLVRCESGAVVTARDVHALNEDKLVERGHVADGQHVSTAAATDPLASLLALPPLRTIAPLVITDKAAAPTTADTVFFV